MYLIANSTNYSYPAPGGYQISQADITKTMGLWP